MSLLDWCVEFGSEWHSRLMESIYYNELIKKLNSAGKQVDNDSV